MRSSFHTLALLLVVHTLGCSDEDEDEGAATSAEFLLPDPARPPAPTAGSPCALAPEGVTTLERPMFPEREGSPTFGYSFKVFPGTDPNAATVIYFSGGPGQPGIDAERNPDYGPPSYTVIETDLRGVGCNAPETPEHYPDAFYRSVYFADDVVAIIESLGLDNYVLYGISYGTALATTLANRIEERGLPAPRALVLEGVFGTAFTSDLPGTAVAFEEQWRIVRDSLGESIISQLTADPLPLGLTPEQWGAGIQGALPLGATPMSGGLSYLFAVLTSLTPGLPDEPRDALRDFILSAGEAPVDAMGERLHEVITCNELADTDFSSLRLEQGELVPDGIECGDIELTEPFSAADWPVRAPIYYFSGTVDTNTPPWQVRAHFDAQTTAPRQLVHVEGGGHNPRTINFTDCNDALWQAMAAGTGFEAALTTCAWPHELESAPAVQ